MTKIVLSCTDEHQLGLFVAKVQKWRPPKPYKGKVHLISDFSALPTLVEPNLRVGDFR